MSSREQVRDASIAIYQYAVDHAATRGIIIADTKFEFGLDEEGQLRVMDEVLTPDSSRFWPEESYQPGTSPPSYDKQFVRDYLETLDWDKTPPPPPIPAEIIEATAAKYREAYERLTGPETWRENHKPTTGRIWRQPREPAEQDHSLDLCTGYCLDRGCADVVHPFPV